MLTAIVVTFIDDNGFPVRQVFADETGDPNRKTFEMKIPLKDAGRDFTIQVEIIPPVGVRVNG